MKKRWLMGASLLTVSLLVGCGETPNIDNDDPITPVEETYDITIAEDNEVELDLNKTLQNLGKLLKLQLNLFLMEEPLKRLQLILMVSQ